MSLFHHPHLTRGIVRTEFGSFEVSRGLVEMPEAIGESLGWRLVSDDGASMNGARVAAAVAPGPEATASAPRG